MLKSRKASTTSELGHEEHSMKTSNAKKISAGFFLILAAAWLFVLVKSKPFHEGSTEEPFRIEAANPELRSRLLKRAGRPRKGSVAPRILIVEFSDLQCPSCKSVQSVLDRLLANNPDAALVFEQFPLSVHPWAKQAAAYAECVAANNAPLFWSFVEEVYAHQEGINVSNSENQFRSFIESRGGDGEFIARCAGSQEVEHQIADSIKFGKEIGVIGTPSIFIDGRRIYNLSAANYTLLDKIIQEVIRQKASNSLK